ncbi:MAG: peptidase S41, partial [Flavobacteriales bacterium]
KNDLIRNKEIIKEILSEEIASRYFYQEGRIRTSLNFDKEVQEAIIYLSKQDMYNSVLSVTN